MKKSKEGVLNMEVARITTKGQITIPIEIRKKLNLQVKLKKQALTLQKK